MFGYNLYDDNSPSPIKKANLVSLKKILHNHNINIDNYNNKIICPFPFHQEHTASFYYYQDSNSFYCFGCSNGGGPVEFIALFYGLDKLQSAQKIINAYKDSIDNISEENISNWKERQAYLFEFSTVVRGFIFEYKNQSALEYIENICKEFDEIFYKHTNMDVKGYKFLLKELEKKIKEFNG